MDSLLILFLPMFLILSKFRAKLGLCPGPAQGVTDAEKKDVEIKSADQITNVDASVGDFATIYGKCKAAVEDIYGTKALTQEHIAAVNTLFIQVSKDKYFKERNSE